MSQIDDFLSGRRPQDEETSGSSIDAFLSGGQPQKKKRERRESQATAGDYARAIDSGLAEGVVNLTGGIGTFIQDPAANTLAGVIGAAHMADRGITWLLNKAGVDAEVNPTLQEHARLSSRFAAESRDAQAKDPTNLPARFGRLLQEDSERAAREIKARDQATNPELIAQQQNMGQAEGFMDNLAAIKDNPLAFTRMLSRSAPDMALGVGVGATLHRAGAGLGTVSTAGTLTEAASSAMQGRQGVYQAVMDMPMDALIRSPRYQEVLKDAGGDRAKARQILANELADQVPLLTGAGTAMGTVLTNRLFGGDSTAKTIAGAERMTAKEFGKRTLQDTVEEGVQGVPEDTVQYGATVQADPNQEYDPGGSLAQNLAAGFAMGAGGHGIGYVRDNMGRLVRKAAPAAPTATPPAPVDAQATPASPAAAPAASAPAPSPAPATDPTARLAELEILAEQRDLTPVEREEAAKLLATLSQDDALAEAGASPAPAAREVDPIQQELDYIDTRLDVITPANGYGPAFDQEREELAAMRLELLEQQRAAQAQPAVGPSAAEPAAEPTEAGVQGAGVEGPAPVEIRPRSRDGSVSVAPQVPDGRLTRQVRTEPAGTDTQPAQSGTAAQGAAGSRPTQASPTDFWSFAKSKGYTPAQIKIGTPEHAALKAEYDALKAGKAEPILPPMQPQPSVDLQNRDRSRAASVVQMSDIARNPDYMRLGPSRTPDSGAPMVFAVGDQLDAIAPENFGRQDVAVMSDGQRVPFRYAVVDATKVNPSNFADGRLNPEFSSTTPGTIKALNNGRTAGVRAAHEMGTAGEYVAGLQADEAMHGIPADVIARTPNPMLVRVYSDAANTANMAAKSQGQGLGMSPAELARQDAPLMDSSVLGVYEPGEITSAANRDFVRAFIGKLQAAGQDVAGMMTGDGQLSQDGRKRIQAALMQAAYGDSDIVEEMFDSTDTDIKAIGEALKAVAGQWANMRDSAKVGAINPQVDITQNLLQAIGLIRKARRDGTMLYDLVNQFDLMTGETLDATTVGVLRMFYSGQYMTRAVGKDKLTKSLSDYVTAAMATSADHGLFGDVVTAGEILATINPITEGQSDAEAQPEEGRGQPAGSGDPGVGAGEARTAVGRQRAGESGPGATADRGSEPGQDAAPESQQQAGQGDPRAEEGDGAAAARAGAGQQEGADGRAAAAEGRAGAADGQAVKAKKPKKAAKPKAEPDALPADQAQQLERDFRTFPTQILNNLLERGEAAKLYKAAGVNGASAFGDLAMDDKAAAYVKFVQQGGKPVENLPKDYNAWVKSEERAAEVRRLQSDRVVRQENGKPFKSKTSAQQYQERYDLTGTHEVVAVDGGFELRQLSPAAQAELKRKAEGRESYTEAQAAVAEEMGIGQTPDGEWDATDDQFDEMERRVQARMRDEPADPILTAPTREDVLAQQERAETAAQRDEREQIRRESEVGAGMFSLEMQDGRQDTTGDLFRQPAAAPAPAPAPAATQAKPAPASDAGKADVERRPNLKNGPSSANVPVAPPAPVPSGIPSAQARWGVFMPAERREMLRAAGYTDADQARALSGLKWVELSEQVRKAVDAAHKKQVTAQAPSAQTKPAEAAPADPFAGNKLFTSDKVAAARERLRKKLSGSQLNSGIDPELLMDGMTIAGAYIEAGVRSFADYAKRMIEDLGDGVKPYLLSFWEAARNYPGLDTEGMTSVEESKRLHKQMLTPEVKAQAAEAIGEVAPKPAKRTKKTGSKADMTLTQDWGVDHINGYGDANRETGNTTKDAFLAEARNYLRAVEAILAEHGYSPQPDRDGRPRKGVSVNEGGADGSGEVSLAVFNPEVGAGVYVHIGDTALRGAVPVTPSGIAVMFRATKEGDPYGALGLNRWAPTDLSAADLAVMVDQEVRRVAASKASPKIDAQERAHDDGQATAGAAGDGAQEQGAGNVQPDAGGRDAEGVSGGPDGRDAGGDQRGAAGRDRRPGERGGPDVRARSARPDAGDQHGGEGGRGERAGAGDGDNRGPVSRVGDNYRIQPGELKRTGSWRATAEQNVRIVELVKQLEAEGRQPTPEEAALLTKFTGWGATEIANGIFPDRYGRYKDATWQALGERLKAALTPEEYAQARRTTQYAHYTSEGVIRSIYDGLRRLGFAGGRVLEPGMGIGLFNGLMPADMAASSQYTGIEYDSITGAIAKLLYPQSNVIVGDYTKTALPREFFDAAIGNPPFGSITITNDPEYKKHGFMLHDYFFAKTIDRVKPGGLVVFVTSKGTMDKANDRARKYLAERADLLGAVRLPQTAFKDNAGTEVVTDVLFLRKRMPGEKVRRTSAGAALYRTNERGEAVGQPVMEVNDWLGLAEVQTPQGPATINEYFAAHPEMVLGAHSLTGSMYRANEYTVVPEPGVDLEQAFARAVANLPEGVYRPGAKNPVAAAAVARERDFNPTHKKEGGLYVAEDGRLMQVESGTGVELTHRRGADGKLIALKPNDKAFLKSWVGLRDALKQAQLDQLTDGDWEKSLKALAAAYDAFVAKHGNLLAYSSIERENEDGTVTVTRRFKNDPLLRLDVDGALAYSLEHIKETGEIVKAPVLSQRVLQKRREPEIKTTQDALFVSLNALGHLDLDDVARRAGMSRQEVIDALGTAIYEVPGEGWQTADEYLSGNVVRKLKEAEAAARADKRYQRNVEALLAVQPKPLGPTEITVKLGQNWIPPSDIMAFAREVLNEDIRVSYNPRLGAWSAEQNGSNYSEFNTPKMSAGAILDAVLNNRTIRVTYRDNEGKTHVDAEATEKANDVARKMREAFSRWIWTDTKRADRLVKYYNEHFNNIAPRRYDGSHLTLPGVSLRFNLYPHQKRAIWRMIQEGDTYLAHSVGAGKTFTMIAAGMEERRLGLSNKPMYVVPNHMLAQFAREFLELYPAANIMVADEQNFHTHNRRRFVAQAALNDPDAIIITHSAFSRIGMSDEFAERFIADQIEEWKQSLDETDQSDRITRKQIERRIEQLERRLEARQNRDKKDQVLSFEELGVDRLFVDEAHEFRKLDFATNQGNIKGIDPAGSQRAMDLFMKVQYLRSKKPGRALVMASGTPITNTMGELFTVQRFFQPDQLAEDGLDTFDAWANQYGDVVAGFEQNAAGGYEVVSRFAKFQNVPELMRRVRSFMDILTSSSLGELVQRPAVKGGGREIVVTPEPDGYRDYQKTLEARINAIRQRKGPPKKGEDIILNVIADGRFSAIDMRFVDPSLPPDPKSKLNQALDDLIAAYFETKDHEYTTNGKVDPIKGSSLILFTDIGLGEQSAKSRGFDMKAWIEKRLTDAGIPREHIAFMRDYKEHAKKERLFADMREGKKRILIGGKDMETGVNVQKRLTHLFHLDAPWFPASVEQREGRIVRQGNQNKEVVIRAYATKGSYDSTMWGMNGRKARFIEQALNGDDSVRSLEDVSEASAFEMAAALASGDERYLKLAGLKADVDRLQRLAHAHHDDQNKLRRDKLWAESAIEHDRALIADLKVAIERRTPIRAGEFAGKVGRTTYDKRDEFSNALFKRFKELTATETRGEETIGEIGGFHIKFHGLVTKGSGSYYATVEVDVPGDPEPLLSWPLDPQLAVGGLATRAANQVNALDRQLAEAEDRVRTNERRIEQISQRLGAPFPEQAELLDKMAQLQALEIELTAEKAAEGGEPVSADAAAATVEAQAQGDGTPMMRRGNAGAMTESMVRQIADTISARWLRAPSIVVVPDMQDMRVPEAARLEDARQRAAGATGVPRGFYYRGTVYLVADGLESVSDVAETLFHEALGHYGLRAVFGSALDGILDQIAMARPDLMRPKAKEYGKDLKVLKQRREVAEEVLAEMAQTKPNLGFVKRAIAAIRTWLRQNVPALKDMALTDAEIINNFILPARGWVERGERAMRPGSQIALSRSAMKSVTANPNILEQAPRPELPETIEVDGKQRPTRNSEGRLIAAKSDAGLVGGLKIVRAGDVVDGLVVREDVPNMGSISASLDDYTVMAGVREVPITAFDESYINSIKPDKLDQRTRDLADEIKASGELNPLIVAFDSKGAYIIEGGHRFDALIASGAKSIPAVVVIDESDPPAFEITAGPQALNQSPAFDGPEVGNTPIGDATEIEVDGVQRPTRNSAGQLIHPTEEGIRNFWRWFGDSKVVDEQGRPLVVYHGSKAAFTEFNAGAGRGGKSRSVDVGGGFYFTPSRALAERYAGQDGVVYPVYLRIKRPMPYEVENGGNKRGESGYKADTLFPGGFTGSQREIDVALANGYDGIIRGDEIIAFRPEQIKSATGNQGTFDPANPDIRFSRSTLGNTPPTPPQNPNAWQKLKAKALELTSPDAIESLIYEYQDKNIDLKRLRDHIKELGGTITDLNDAYLGEELYHKRLAKRMQDFLSEELKPLLADMRARGVDMPTLERYLHARHAPEANRVLAERNPNAQMIEAGKAKAQAEVKALEVQLQRARAQGTATKAIEQALEQALAELDRWTGAQAFKGTEAERLSLSGMSDAEAAAFMGGLPAGQKVHLEALAARVDAMQAKTLEALEKYGLMDKATLDAWRSTYQFYVPLHRDEAHPDAVSHPIGQGFSTKGDASKRRTGSNEKVTNILAHIAMQREAALTRGEKNRVAKKLYMMAAQNPDPEIWSVDKPPMMKTVDRETGFVRTTVDPTYRNKPNVVMVRIGGKDHAITFNERNPKAVRMAQSIKGADVGDLNAFESIMGKATRWLASVNTQYNPIFGIINFARDVQAAILQLSTTPLKGQERAVAAYVPAALKGIYTEVRSRRKGQARGTGQWAKLWEEMQDEGGTTGYRELFITPDERVKALTKELNALERGKASEAAHAVLDWLSDYNETMENAVRLAAYKVALDQGMSKERAASLAKNLTVNFNRRGRQTARLGAYYAFLNATIQGSARLVQTLGGPLGRKIMLGGVMLGAVNALIGMAMMGGDDGEEDNWEKIPDFVKERSLIVPLGREDYLAIPMPLGYQVFPNLGRKAVEMMMHDDPTKGVGSHIADMLRITLDAFNPLGGSENLAQMVTPTPFDPAVALMMNRDWTGKPIYREDNSNLDPTPGHQRTKDTASAFSKAVSEALNKITGGTDYQPGAVSVTPDQIDYVIGQITGGMGREILKLENTITAPLTGDELPAYKIPMVGRLYGNTRGPANNAELFYEHVRELNQIENEIRGRARDGGDVAGYMAEEPLSALVGMGNAAENQIRKLRQYRAEVVRRAEPGYQDEVKRINEQMGEVMKLLNQEVRRAKKEAAEAP